MPNLSEEDLALLKTKLSDLQLQEQFNLTELPDNPQALKFLYELKAKQKKKEEINLRRARLKEQGAEFNGRGHLYPLMSNVKIVFNELGFDVLFRFNQFSNEAEITQDFELCGFKRGQRLNDEVVLALRVYLSDNYFLNITNDMAWEVVMWHARQKAYHPITEWLSALEWDGTARVENFLIEQGVCESNAYNRWVSALLLVSAISRVMHPGCQYDYMVVLEGNQGLGKSRTIEALAGPTYSNIMSLTDRDTHSIQKMQGLWFIEIAELPFLNKRDLDSMKAFLTTGTDKARFPWDRSYRVLPRQNIFVGTFNPDDMGYLGDIENRRFLPIRINKKIDFNKIKENRDQLFAEALLMYMANFKLYPQNKEFEDVIKGEQEGRMVHDEWLVTLEGFIVHRRRQNIEYVLGRDFYLNKEFGIGGQEKDFNPAVGRRINKLFIKLGLPRTKQMRYKSERGVFYDIRLYDRFMHEIIDGVQDELKWKERDNERA